MRALRIRGGGGGNLGWSSRRVAAYRHQAEKQGGGQMAGENKTSSGLMRSDRIMTSEEVG